MPFLRTVTALVFVLSLDPATAPGQALPGTRPWDDTGDPASAMVEGIHRFLDRELKASVEKRQAHWDRDFSNQDEYVISIAPNRARVESVRGVELFVVG